MMPLFDDVESLAMTRGFMAFAIYCLNRALLPTDEKEAREAAYCRADGFLHQMETEVSAAVEADKKEE